MSYHVFHRYKAIVKLIFSNITQKVYLRERPHDVPEADTMSWWLPVVVTRESNLKAKKTVPPAWMKEKSALVIKDVPNKDKFLIVNPEEIGKWKLAD